MSILKNLQKSSPSICTQPRYLPSSALQLSSRAMSQDIQHATHRLIATGVLGLIRLKQWHCHIAMAHEVRPGLCDAFSHNLVRLLLNHKPVQRVNLRTSYGPTRCFGQYSWRILETGSDWFQSREVRCDLCCVRPSLVRLRHTRRVDRSLPVIQYDPI